MKSGPEMEFIPLEMMNLNKEGLLLINFQELLKSQNVLLLVSRKIMPTQGGV